MSTRRLNPKEVNQNSARMNKSFVFFVLPALLTLMMLGRSKTPAWRTVWAEDGSIFYAQLQNNNLWDFLSASYNGQYLFLTRALFLPMEFINVEYLSYYCFAISGLTYFLLLHLIAKLLLKEFGRTRTITILVATAFLPIASAESLQNINNLPWFWVIGWVLITYIKKDMNNLQVQVYRIATVILLFSLPAAFVLFLLSLLLNSSVNFVKRFKAKSDGFFLLMSISIGIWQLLHSFSTRVQVPEQINLGNSLADMIYRIALIPGTGRLMYSVGDTATGNTTLTKLVISYICLALALVSLIRVFSHKNLLISKGSLFGILASLYFITFAGVLVQLKDFTYYYFNFPLAHARYFVTASFAFFFLLVLVMDFTSKTLKNRVILGLTCIFLPVVFIANFAINPSRNGPDYPSQAEVAISQCTQDVLSTYRIFVSPYNDQWFFDYNCD